MILPEARIFHQVGIKRNIFCFESTLGQQLHILLRGKERVADDVVNLVSHQLIYEVLIKWASNGIQLVDPRDGSLIDHVQNPEFGLSI